MISRVVEKFAFELVTDAADKGGFWERISPETLETIVRAVTSDIQRDAALVAFIERTQTQDTDEW